MTMPTGHHPIHAGLPGHSVGANYPLAIVGYGDLWVIENLVNGTVMCPRGTREPYAYDLIDEALSVLNMVAQPTHKSKSVWVKGRPRWDHSSESLVIP
jgi:hypothetical protein